MYLFLKVENKMAICYLDIETIPCQTPGYFEKCLASIKAPGNYSKPDTINKWMEENKFIEADKLHRKTSFDGALGEIISIAWAIDDNPVDVIYRDNLLIDDEKKLLVDFFDEISKLTDDHGQRTTISTWIGHYLTGFDLRFLWQRCVINGIKPSVIIPYDAKPWDPRVFDTKLEWTGASSSYSGIGKLGDMSQAFGFKGKGDLDGSKVYDYWIAGCIEEIAEYNKEDVEMCRRLYKKMNFLDVLK